MTIENVSLTIEIDSGNAALVENPHEELAAIVRVALRSIEQGPAYLHRKLYDRNGNSVGYFEYSED
jgi:hypothetical protein